MSVEEYMTKRLKELCNKHDVSKYRLSILTGMTQTALGNIIDRNTMPTIATLEKICDAFGLTLAQFFADEDDKPDLTADEFEILDIWSELDTKEKEILMTFIRSLRK